MTGEERPMISHVSLGVRDLSRSGRFYDAVLAPVGCSRSAAAKPGELAFGPNGQGIFWLYQVESDNPLGSPGTHFAFSAPDRAAVHAAANAVRAGGGEFTREAGPHPDIAPDYYGTVFFDPDGHKIELVVE
jgi:catechol 2,3-dioxygenase-like lactoylglutathione lyase family enzyme